METRICTDAEILESGWAVNRGGFIEVAPDVTTDELAEAQAEFNRLFPSLADSFDGYPLISVRFVGDVG